MRKLKPHIDARHTGCSPLSYYHERASGELTPLTAARLERRSRHVFRGWSQQPVRLFFDYFGNVVDCCRRTLS